MSQIRAKQIRLNDQGDLIIGNSLDNGSILPVGDLNQTLHVIGSSVGWQWTQTLYDVSGNLVLDTIPSPGLVNYLTIAAGTSGNGPYYNLLHLMTRWYYLMHQILINQSTEHLKVYSMT